MDVLFRVALLQFMVHIISLVYSQRREKQDIYIPTAPTETPQEKGEEEMQYTLLAVKLSANKCKYVAQLLSIILLLLCMLPKTRDRKYRTFQID